MLTVYNANESRLNTTKAAKATDNLRSGCPNASDQNNNYYELQYYADIHS